MRRLLYLAVALALLALTGLAFLRVTSSGAYVARSRLARIREGMSRELVLEMMQDVNSMEGFDRSPMNYNWGDCWQTGGGYSLHVIYSTDDQKKRSVGLAWVEGPTEETAMDRALDFLGYPRGQMPFQTVADKLGGS
jgi:hypothetical protein